MVDTQRTCSASEIGSDDSSNADNAELALMNPSGFGKADRACTVDHMAVNAIQRGNMFLLLMNEKSCVDVSFHLPT